MKLTEVTNSLFGAPIKETWIDNKKQSVSNASEARKLDKDHGVGVDYNEEDESWENDD